MQFTVLINLHISKDKMGGACKWRGYSGAADCEARPEINNSEQ